MDPQMQSFEHTSTVIQCLAVSTNTAENVALLRKQQQSLQSFMDAVAQIKKILNVSKSNRSEYAPDEEKDVSEQSLSIDNQSRTITSEQQRKMDCDSTLKCNASNSTASCTDMNRQKPMNR